MSKSIREYDENDRWRSPYFRDHKPELPGSNAIDPARPLYGATHPHNSGFVARATRFKEALSMQQMFVQHGRDIKGRDMRSLGMYETVAEPAWVRRVHPGLRTGATTEDEDFQHFLREAMLRDRAGEKPDMNDFEAVKKYLEK